MLYFRFVHAACSDHATLSWQLFYCLPLNILWILLLKLSFAVYKKCAQHIFINRKPLYRYIVVLMAGILAFLQNKDRSKIKRWFVFYLWIKIKSEYGIGNLVWNIFWVLNNMPKLLCTRQFSLKIMAAGYILVDSVDVSEFSFHR